MDMKIAGAGVLSGGEYEEIKVSGSAKLAGSIRCRSFACAGAAKGEGDVSCREDFRCAGSAGLNGAVDAETIHVSGSLKCASLAARGEMKLSGGVTVEGKLSGSCVRVSGSLKVGGGVEAEEFSSGGRLRCEGLLNAERAELELGGEPSRVAAIGGGSVRVRRGMEGHIFGGFRFPWGKSEGGSLTVDESIEADEVELEDTDCPLVTGRRVTIGPGCRIGLVRYSESLEVDPEASVERQERL